jgi:MFS family permease
VVGSSADHSNHLGRRPVSIAALGVAALGCLVLMDVHRVGMLLLGRALQGLAADLAEIALAAYSVDTAPASPRWLVSTVTSSGMSLLGLAIDAFGAGALVDIGPAPNVLTAAFPVKAFWSPFRTDREGAS